MNNSFKQGLLALAAVIALASCSDDFLNRYPDGNTISADQYNKLDLNTRLTGTMRGLYSMIYSDNSSDHDEFGQRSIDLWGDILCGDIAVTNKTYGWLYQDEQMFTVIGRTGYIWSFYYKMIRNINTAVRDISNACDIRDSVATFVRDHHTLLPSRRCRICALPGSSTHIACIRLRKPYTLVHTGYRLNQHG